MTDTAFLSAGELAGQIREGKISSLELTELYIARIEMRDKEINAVVVRDFDPVFPHVDAVRGGPVLSGRRDASPLLVWRRQENDRSDNDLVPSFPASYQLPTVVSVANTDRFDRLAGSSSFGATSVDLGAPGTAIRSTFPGNQYGTISGTSMASPHVAGAAMLTWTEHPTFDVLDVKETLEARRSVGPQRRQRAR